MTDNAYLALYRNAGPHQRAQTALVTSVGGGRLALVYLDERVVVEEVLVNDDLHLFPFKEQPPCIDTAREQFRGIAEKLGFDQEAQTYIGEIESGQAHDDAAGSGTPASEPGDAEELASTGPGPGVCPGGHGDSLPPAGRGSVGEGEHVHDGLCFEDLIGSDDNEEGIFS